MSVIYSENGHPFTVDDDDAGLVSAMKWRVYATGGSRYTHYVMTEVEGRRVYLHRLLMNAGPDEQVDHIDGNGLNNCRENLRKCSHAENHENLGVRRDSGTGVRGVYLRRRGNRSFYVAYARRRGKMHRAGEFRSLAAAEKAAIALRAKLFTHSSERKR